MSGTLLPHGWPDGLPNPDLHDPDAADWWRQCSEHRLTMQLCSSCDAVRFPPAPRCHRCLSGEFSWKEVGPDGTIYSYAVVHHPGHPGLAEVVPYTFVIVVPDGSEGERTVGNILGPTTEGEMIGRRVTLVWEDVASGEGLYSLPQWSLA